MDIIYGLIYLMFLFLLYFIVIKRLKVLSERHAEYTGIHSLKRGYRIIRRRMIVILLLQAFISIFIYMIIV